MIHKVFLLWLVHVMQGITVQVLPHVATQLMVQQETHVLQADIVKVVLPAINHDVHQAPTVTRQA